MQKINGIVAGLALALFAAMPASALDANEIVQLVKNDVQDTVIINMLQQNKLERPLTAQEVLILSNEGASSTLLEYLTRPESVSSSYVPPARTASSPVIVTDSTTSVVETVSPTIVTSEPSVVVTSPNTVYYGSTYAYPSTYYYPYTYSYPYTYRYGPTYSFGFSWGNSHRWRGRDHGYRPRPPSHHRPPHSIGRPSGGRPGGHGRPGGGRPGGGRPGGGRPGGGRPSRR